MKRVFKSNFWLLVFAAFFFGAGYLLDRSINLNEEEIAKKFESVLSEKEKDLEDELEKFSKQKNLPEYYSELFEEQGIILLSYTNKALSLWSDNTVCPSSPDIFLTSTPGILKLQRGWFEARVKKEGEQIFVGLLLIKNEFPYQNNYLNSYFSKGLRVIKKATLKEVSEREGIVVYNNLHQPLCRYVVIDDSPVSSLPQTIDFLLYLTGVLLLIRFLYRECRSYSRTIGKLWPYAVYLFTLLALRFLTVYLKFPESVYSTDLFGPRYFADANSFWLSSLGDFLVNAILFLYISYFLYKTIQPGAWIEKINSGLKITISVLIFLLACRLSWGLNTLFVGLIRNSSIPFNINNLFSLTAQTYIALAILGCLFLSYFLIVSMLLRVVLQFKQSTITEVFTLVIAILLHSIWCQSEGRLDYIAIMWGFVIVSIIYSFQRTNLAAFPFWLIVVLIFGFSLYAVHTFLKHNRFKEDDLREAYADKLSVERDPIAVHLFSEIENSLPADTALKRIFQTHPINYSEIEKRFQQHYLGGYWEKYDVSIAVFDSMCYPVLNSGFNHVDNIFEFDNLIETKGEETTSEHFFYITNDNGKINYMAHLPFRSNESAPPFAAVFIDFKSRVSSEEIGFPDLLLDKSVNTTIELKNYSYAKYKNGTLVSQSGKYIYPRSSAIFDATKPEKFIAEIDGYNHLVVKSEENGIVVISKGERTTLDEVTTFSYLFAFLSLFLLIIISIRQLAANNEFAFNTISFKYKLQVLLISIVLISLLLFGAGTIYFIQKQFNAKSSEIISEKMHSVQIEVQSKLLGENDKTFQFKEYAAYILKKFSNVFFTDITLYDKNGNLVASSQSKLFEEGLLSTKMNYEAYEQVVIKDKTEYIHNEAIGKLNYLSGYLPFTDKNGTVLGYLNLPYFAKQSDLEKEISSFLVALVNVYVLLFALTVLIAIFFSNYLTRPLRIIQEKMSTLKLGKPNEFIEWRQKDEIGNLVAEYNRMILELSKSAELLARSEREIAWREMAKQVAHEIKNPLTPMKLSIQHLKKLWQNKSPDIDEKIESTTKMLIEQIDSLTSIANEFSNFAKMPKANEESINIKNILGNIVELYKDSIDISLKDKCEGVECVVVADKEQLLRVFNNLVKNSVQAIPEDRNGKIEIIISLKDESVVVAVKDNGTGINERSVDKIFMPNFTTKTAGMGLGLAMVKNIVESSKGKIWFETTGSVGTTFYVSLPVVNDEL